MLNYFRLFETSFHSLHYFFVVLDIYSSIQFQRSVEEGQTIYYGKYS